VKRTPGLKKRGKYWHIQKVVLGITISESTHCTDLAEAESILNKRVKETRDIHLHGKRPVVTFNEAVDKYGQDKKAMKSIKRDLASLDNLKPYLGDMDIRFIHTGTLKGFIEDRQDDVKNVTINRDLSALRTVLSRAARVWRHDNNMPYIDTAPLIEMLPDDSRPPHQISMEEQGKIFGGMSAEYARYALFLVNTGMRCGEGLKLKWTQRVKDQPAFIIPPEDHKNGCPRLVVCNSVAESVLGKARWSGYVFPITYEAFRSAWERAREDVGLGHVRRHDLKHTFGMRLRAAGVPFEDRQDLLGHKSSRITDHYSAPTIERLLESAESVVGMKEPALRLVEHNKDIIPVGRLPSAAERDFLNRYEEITGGAFYVDGINVVDIPEVAEIKEESEVIGGQTL